MLIEVGKSIRFKLEQLQKALPPISSVPSGTFNAVNDAHPQNASFPMKLIEVGKSIWFKLEQSSKAHIPISLVPFGILILCNDLHLKDAPPLIYFKVEGSSTIDNESQ